MNNDTNQSLHVIEKEKHITVKLNELLLEKMFELMDKKSVSGNQAK